MKPSLERTESWRFVSRRALTRAFRKEGHVPAEKLTRVLFAEVGVVKEVTLADAVEQVYSEAVDEKGLASRRALAALQAEVAGPLYFVLLHEDDGKECELVVVFALGKSRRGPRLLGVVTQQGCHNLCD